MTTTTVPYEIHEQILGSQEGLFELPPVILLGNAQDTGYIDRYKEGFEKDARRRDLSQAVQLYCIHVNSSRNTFDQSSVVREILTFVRGKKPAFVNLWIESEELSSCATEALFTVYANLVDELRIDSSYDAVLEFSPESYQAFAKARDESFFQAQALQAVFDVSRRRPDHCLGIYGMTEKRQGPSAIFAVNCLRLRWV